MIRVIIADDHNLVRQGIRALLERAEDIQIVGEASDGQEALDLVERLKPQVLVLDMSMPRLNGVQVLDQLRTQNAATYSVMLSMYSDEALVQQALRSGAKGYLLKGSLMEELLVAVRAASRGQTYLSPAIAGNLISDFMIAKVPATRFEQLSLREREVLKLLVEGHTNNAVAQRLNISVRTAEKHRTNLMTKLDVHDLAGLIRVALKHGLIFLDD